MPRVPNLALWLSRLGSPKQIIKFFWVGLANSAVTYLIYLAFNLILDYRISYTLSYISGILFSVYFNGRFVFQTSVTIKTVIEYLIFYSTSFGLGILLLTFFVSYVHLSELLAPLFVLITVVPINFFGARFVLTGSFLNKLNVSANDK